MGHNINCSLFRFAALLTLTYASTAQLLILSKMKEKLGSGNSAKKSEIAEVTAELKVTDSLREHVKKLIKLLNKSEKSIKRMFSTSSYTSQDEKLTFWPVFRLCGLWI